MTLEEMMTNVTNARTDFKNGLRNMNTLCELEKIIFQYYDLCCSNFEEEVITENLREVYQEYKNSIAA